MPVLGSRRPMRGRGQGALELRRAKSGVETWYARFYVAGRQQRHRIGLRRRPGETVGLTKVEAEAKLRALMQNASAKAAESERLTVEQAAERYIEFVET